MSPISLKFCFKTTIFHQSTPSFQMFHFIKISLCLRWKHSVPTRSDDHYDDGSGACILIANLFVTMESTTFEFWYDDISFTKMADLPDDLHAYLVVITGKAFFSWKELNSRSKMYTVCNTSSIMALYEYMYARIYECICVWVCVQQNRTDVTIQG